MFFGLKRFEYTGYFGYVSKTKKNTFSTVKERLSLSMIQAIIIVGHGITAR